MVYLPIQKTISKMQILVTGSEGFIGKNLVVRLKELNIGVVSFNRNNSKDDLADLISNSDFIVHLAGENRPKNEKEYQIVNTGLTKLICETTESLGKKIPILLASSTQVEYDNSYGKSKLDAELILRKFEKNTNNSVYIYRMPGVFGKWCKPNYNSVVATFCYNVLNNQPLQVNDNFNDLRLVYIDDVIDEFLSAIHGHRSELSELIIRPEYTIKLLDLANQIKSFKLSRKSLISERVGDGFTRKLYSTYLSYLTPKQFVYSIASHSDERGIFAEMIKTKDSGQFSFFTAKPGITRGGHYHHSKNEKFLVVQGKARFKFRNIISNEISEINISEGNLKIVETAPGWAHDITNTGKNELIVLLWANEIFDKDKSDTINYKV